MKYKVLVVDDDINATENLEGILSNFFEKIEIVGVSNSASDALFKIEMFKPDIIFLDIEMPDMSGFDMLKQIEDPQFEIIFITAFNQYAVEAFKTNAVDYLLKPINIEKCEQALDRAIDRIKGKIRNNADFKMFLSDVVGTYSHKIAIISKDGIDYIKTSDIIYVMADEAYSIVVTTNKKYMSSKHLVTFKKQLINHNFVQVHQSYIINLEHVKTFNRRENYILMSNDHQTKISRRSRSEFIDIMNNFNYSHD